jgi:endonuclease-3
MITRSPRVDSGIRLAAGVPTADRGGGGEEGPMGRVVRRETREGAPAAGSEPFDIDEVFRRLRQAVAGLPKAAMFDLRDRGFGSPFEQLVGSLISARTRDETTTEVCLRLFARARTPEALLAIDEAELARLLTPATFAEAKARDLRAIARQIVEEHGGRVPDTVEGLTSFRGVGPKIAALTLAVGFGRPAIAVDVHVHRVANRWGYVAARTPEQTAAALAAKLPERYWVEINERLVPFGKHVCTGVRPRCSTCLLLSMCRQVGVTGAR